MRSGLLVFLSLLTWLVRQPFDAAAQQEWNLPVLSRWDDDNIPNAWTGAFNECWGYAANGREYAFLGSTLGTYFFDVTNPSAPVMIHFAPNRDTVSLVTNKDFATYSHYLYAVSDQGANSLQIFDLQYLPDSVVKVYDDDALSKRCHTIFVEKDRLYMASNTRPNATFGPMDIVSVADPLNPVLLGTLSHPGFSSVHDTYVKNDTAYCSNGSKGLWIYDLQNPSAPFLISILDIYNESGYNHSSWLTDDGHTMVFTDENHGKGVKVYDVSDIHDPQFRSMIRSNMLQVPDPLTDNGSVAHNPYIVGNTLFISYYHDGVLAYNISDPSNPVLIGYNDIHTQNTSYYSYNGCWGVYPFLPSGNLIASDISNGLFMLDGSKVLQHTIEPSPNESLILLNNPINNDEVVIQYQFYKQTEIDLLVWDVSGRMVRKLRKEIEAGNGTVAVQVPELSAGIYIVKASGEGIEKNWKFIKTKK